MDGPFKGRLLWNGSKDLQDVSIYILNVSESDGGLYECVVKRHFKFGDYTLSANSSKTITLTVKEKGTFICFCFGVNTVDTRYLNYCVKKCSYFCPTW